MGGDDVVDHAHHTGLLRRDELAGREQPQRDLRRHQRDQAGGSAPRRREAQLVVDEAQLGPLDGDPPVTCKREVDAPPTDMAVQERHGGHLERRPSGASAAPPRPATSLAGEPLSAARSAPDEKMRVPAPVTATSRTAGSAASASAASASCSSVSSDSAFSPPPRSVSRPRPARPDRGSVGLPPAGGRRTRPRATARQELGLGHPPVALDAALAGEVVQLVQQRFGDCHHVGDGAYRPARRLTAGSRRAGRSRTGGSSR